MRRRYALVDEQRTNDDGLTLDSSVRDERVLLIEIRDESGSIMASVALRREYEPNTRRNH